MEANQRLVEDFYSAEEKLSKLGQTHLLKFWDTLTDNQKRNLLKDIADIDTEFFEKQRYLLQQKKKSGAFTPFKNFTLLKECSSSDLTLLSQGKAGAVIFAGGLGSRLGVSGPKGAYPISNVKNKSLFQLFCEKTFYASKLAGVDLFLAIMTSKNNHDQTIEYFQLHHFFGLNPKQVFFFIQTEAPFLDTDGHLFLSSPSNVAKGPDGNGAFFSSFLQSGIWDLWKEKGIDYVNCINIDNPLADPFDLNLLNYHDNHKGEVSVKCVDCQDPSEKVGILVADGEKVRIVEYTEIHDADRKTVDHKGNLMHRCANIGLFCLSMDFIQKVAKEDQLPYHLAFKTADYVDESGEVKRSKTAIAYKFEKFIFDMLPLADRVGVVLYPRELCFAPLKNVDGENSPKTVRQALQNADIFQWKMISQTKVTKKKFELSQEFYYPSQDFLNRWHNRKMPIEDYINDEGIGS